MLETIAKGRLEMTPAAKPPASDAVAAQEAQFNDEMEERAELLREANAMRDMMLAQLKVDDETLKKYIAMIE
ncbi:MAG TPA: hypothetical protein VKT72_05300 [Candidatus Baltobacteraceae bacterium]|nr:hypothetical protein [Candidatus Baltobacteraceae bacterium]